MKTIMEKYKLNAQPHWYIAWLTNKVILGIWETVKDGADFDYEMVLQLRIFNEAEELFIWKKGNELNARHANQPWDKNLVFIQKPFMWGKELIDNKLFEPNQGLEIKLERGVPIAGNLPLRYQVENLYEYDNNGNLRFTDARLTHILGKEGEIIALEVKNG